MICQSSLDRGILTPFSGLREYFEDSARTRQIIRDGWLYAGDLAFKGSDGSLYFVDRKKDMVRRSGENISPQQVREEPIDGLGETFDRGDRRFKDVRSAAD